MYRSVGENEEVSIKEVADAIVKAVGFEGEYKVNRISGIQNILPYHLLVSHGSFGIVRHFTIGWPIPQTSVER